MPVRCAIAHVCACGHGARVHRCKARPHKWHTGIRGAQVVQCLQRPSQYWSHCNCAFSCFPSGASPPCGTTVYSSVTVCSRRRISHYRCAASHAFLFTLTKTYGRLFHRPLDTLYVQLLAIECKTPCRRSHAAATECRLSMT